MPKTSELIENLLSKHSLADSKRIVESALADRTLKNERLEDGRKTVCFLAEHHDFLWKHPDYPIINDNALRLNALILGENLAPTEGIYYLLLRPDGWKLYPHRFDTEGEINHDQLWIYVAKMVANAYASTQIKESDDVKQLAAKFMALRQGRGASSSDAIYAKIKDSIYGFPRGRIGKTGPGKYVVRNGNDWKFTGVSKNAIEQAFGIEGKCKWEFDIHEQCMIEDRDKLRSVLGIKETWPAETIKPNFD